jgi:hypothetical protein
MLTTFMTMAVCTFRLHISLTLLEQTAGGSIQQKHIAKIESIIELARELDSIKIIICVNHANHHWTIAAFDLRRPLVRLFHSELMDHRPRPVLPFP